MPKFDVLDPLKRNGERFEPGDSVDIEKDNAKPLLASETIGVPGSYEKSLLTLETLEVKNKKLVDEIAAVQKENANLKEQLSRIAKGQDDKKDKGGGK